MYRIVLSIASIPGKLPWAPVDAEDRRANKATMAEALICITTGVVVSNPGQRFIISHHAKLSAYLVRDPTFHTDINPSDREVPASGTHRIEAFQLLFLRMSGFWVWYRNYGPRFWPTRRCGWVLGQLWGYWMGRCQSLIHTCVHWCKK